MKTISEFANKCLHEMNFGDLSTTECVIKYLDLWHKSQLTTPLSEAKAESKRGEWKSRRIDHTSISINMPIGECFTVSRYDRNSERFVLTEEEMIAICSMIVTAGSLTQKYGSLEALEKRMIEAEERNKEISETLVSQIENEVRLEKQVDELKSEIRGLLFDKTTLEKQVSELRSAAQKAASWIFHQTEIDYEKTPWTDLTNALQFTENT